MRTTLSALLLLLPTAAFAAGTTLNDIIIEVTEVLNYLLPIAVSFALLTFIWGLVLFIGGLGSNSLIGDTKKTQGQAAVTTGKARMVWGIVALFVIVSVWGIIGFFGNVFGVFQGGTCTAPRIGASDVSSCF